MDTVGTFPFGQPIIPVAQKNRIEKEVFVLGVYASAVHAKWIGPDIKAVAVASEPEIFWCGDGAVGIIRSIAIPPNAGRLEPAGKHLNGPSGRALDELYLKPLRLTRDKTWLCDLVPHSCMNRKQAKALEERYRPEMQTYGLPEPDWRTVPQRLTDEKRRKEIETELQASKAKVIITLGDQPLKWFTRFYGSKGRLGAYGEDRTSYGRFHPIRIGTLDLALLPVVHPRQAGKLGSHSSDWADLHDHWTRETAPSLL